MIDRCGVEGYGIGYVKGKDLTLWGLSMGSLSPEQLLRLMRHTEGKKQGAEGNINIIDLTLWGLSNSGPNSLAVPKRSVPLPYPCSFQRQVMRAAGRLPQFELDSITLSVI